jgi:hypothetical protein
MPYTLRFYVHLFFAVVDIAWLSNVSLQVDWLEVSVKTFVQWAVCYMSLTVTGISGAAGFTPVPVNCSMVQSSAVTNLDQRIEVAAAGFSVLPPQGKNWCAKSMASLGLSFLKAPVIVTVSKQSPSPDELFTVALQAVRFTGFAVGFPDFGFNTESPEHLKVAVDEMISTHIFFQFMTGINSSERRYQLVDSHSEVDRSLGASCVRFDAKCVPPVVILDRGGLCGFFLLSHGSRNNKGAASRCWWTSLVKAMSAGDFSERFVK